MSPDVRRRTAAAAGRRDAGRATADGHARSGGVAGRILLLAASGLAAAGAAIFGYAVVVGRRRFRVQRIELPVLPKGAAPIRVLQVSDLHLLPSQHRKIEWVRRLRRLDPDVVVLAGDNLGGRGAIAALRTLLAPFHGIPGVFVLGSNDYFSPLLRNPLEYVVGRRPRAARSADLETDELVALLRDELGWADLDNATVRIEVPERPADARRSSTTRPAATGHARPLRFVGLGDPHIELDDEDAVGAAVAAEAAEAIASRGEADDRPPGGESDDNAPAATIGVVHAPYRRALDALVERFGADLVFAGHTHGGQVCLPGGRALTSNCDLPVAQAGGLSWWKTPTRGAWLAVSRGLGTSRFAPYRLNCPPEATLATLVPRR